MDSEGRPRGGGKVRYVNRERLHLRHGLQNTMKHMFLLGTKSSVLQRVLVRLRTFYYRHIHEIRTCQQNLSSYP